VVHARSLGPDQAGSSIIGIAVPAGTSTPKRPKAAEKAKAIAVGEATFWRVELTPDVGDHLLCPCLDDLFPRRCRLLVDEVVFSIGGSLGVDFVDGDDFLPLGEEVASLIPETMDHVSEAEAPIFDERRALADVSALF
jgi:hypothetical protein